MLFNNKLKATLLSFAMATAMGAGCQTLTIDAGERGDAISPTLYGIFFEEINHAGDGGLYAELVANRSFAKNNKQGSALEYWERFGGATISTATGKTIAMLNAAQERCARVMTTAAGQGILNNGYKGMNIVSGTTYKVSLFAKATEAGANISVKLLAADKATVLGEAQLGQLTTEWQKLSATITATGDAERGTMAVTVDAATTFFLDVVSLFPPTYKNRENGMRIDMAQALEELHPAFMRFPGGCYVEGLYNSSVGASDNHYEWKKTIGPIEERPGHYNCNWGYEVNDGMGALEYLQFCEDLGAAPLYVTNIGIGHDWKAEIDSIGEYIQDALDFIEFANGDETTTWGKKRIELGHEEPFNLTLLEIGNENNPMGNDVDNGYYLRYQKFHDAISEKYPYIQFIGNGVYNGTGWNSAYKADIVDEHYYDTPDFFIRNYGLYDDASRTAHKRYVGEYAVTSDFGKIGNLRAALGEAVFMCGMERNSEAVTMCSYAPIFQNDDLPGWWATEMIHFNNHDLFRTPSYYMQSLFPKYLGAENVSIGEEDNVKETSAGDSLQIGVGSWLAASTYKDLKVTLADGTIITPTYTSDMWTSNDSGTDTWAIDGSSIRQTDDTKTMQMNIFGTKFAKQDYIYELTATKQSGGEGFIVPFSYINSDNYSWLNVGGWGNTKTSFEQCVGGTRATIGSMPQQVITTGQEYAIKIVVSGTKAKAYIDGKLICSATLSTEIPNNERKVYTSASISAGNDMVFLRIINPYETERQVTIHMKNADITSVSGEVVTGDKDDENSWDDTEKVKPQDITTLTNNTSTITYTVAPYSANFINIGVENVDTPAGSSVEEIAEGDRRQGDRNIYTLSGVKLGSVPAKGIYIQSGRVKVNY